MQTMVSTAGGTSGPTESTDELAPGAKAGPWVVERELGRGGMGAVYAVVHDEIGKKAALKLMHRRLLTPSFNVERILLEAKVVNAVAHPNIVDIFETGTLGDGRPYIVMERLEGMPLSYRVDERKLLATEVINILLQLTDALIAAHAANVVHRDLKLDNVFLVDNPDDPQNPKVKVLDWGIAKVIDHDVRHTIEGQLVGTPQYLSPEQAKGARVTSKSDVYSLGVMAYEMFLEQLPFEAETSAEIMAMHLRAIPPAPSELWPDIPPELEQLLLVMLAKNPDNRPTMKEVAQTLESIRTGFGIPRREPRAPSAPIIAPNLQTAPRARISSAGLAPTMPADSASWPAPRAKKWQIALGGLAVAAGLAMFLVTRGAEPQSAAADTLTSDVATPTEREVRPPELATSVRSTAPITTPAEPTAPPNLAPVIMSGSPERDATADEPRPTKRRAASVQRTSTRKAPTMPRRAAARIDPDGVIDPYR
ncbi:MAG: serine/threonine protein kinase [Kofleriaceae bacterium]